MNFRIADTFTASLARLTADEQKAVKTTAFDLQVDASAPGLSFHRIDKSKDKHFWSVRVGGDIRLIVHKVQGDLLLCFVDHHDRAYEWAERRKLETHPSTGAAQLVEVRETVRQVVVPSPLPAPRPPAAERAGPSVPAPSLPPSPLFADRPDDELLGYGVPVEWLADVKAVTGPSLFALADHLPAEAAEALLELATGGQPRRHPPPAPAATATDPFGHPDAQRRFRVMTNVDALRAALDAPWDKWTVFLHPEQRQWVEREHAGPARVSGSAGTGKTIVALHRAVHLARTSRDARVLLTTFTDTLAHALGTQLQRLLAGEPRLGERIDVYSLDALALRLYASHHGPVMLASREVQGALLGEALAAVAGADHRFGLPFVVSEWEQVVDAWQLPDWASYRGFTRLGRKTRLPESARAALWPVFEAARQRLQARRLTTPAALFDRLAATIAQLDRPPFDFAVVDEAQDVGVAQLRFFAALGGRRADALFFAGDLGQRIFQPPFSWKALGVDIRGRSRTLRVNYRTSHQIREQADRLLGSQTTDADGNSDRRDDTVSTFDGPPPVIRVFDTPADECIAVGSWIAERSRAGLPPHELGVFVRSPAELARAEAAIGAAGLLSNRLDEHVATVSGRVSVSTMAFAKGLEFRAVVVMACDDEVIPLQQRIERVGDAGDLQEVYDSERQLLYVACTRARDQLLVTGVAPASEFLDDLRG